MRRVVFFSITVLTAVSANQTPAAVVINEFLYDDGATDDREFVELFNRGSTPMDVGGWTLGGQDQLGANTTITIPAGIVLDPGNYYVIGQAGVPNVNQVVSSFLENDSETLELKSGSTLIDAVAYETHRGSTSNLPVGGGYGMLPPQVLAEIGPGIWGNNQAMDLAGAVASASLGRFVDGRDSNNNGRDFGYRVSTPGAKNNPTNVTEYLIPNVAAIAPGTSLTNFAYSGAPPRVIDPTVGDTNNPNPIPLAPGGINRAVVAWDPNGGGNGVSSAETFSTSESEFDIYAYFDTRDLPQMTNGATPFRGSEVSIFGIGSTDALSSLPDISGQVGVPDSQNGTTRVAWVYEKVAAPNPNDPLGPGNTPSEMLYLVDAGDGGDAGQAGTRPFDWEILASIDLASQPSSWYRLGIQVDALGSGLARFGDQLFPFTTELSSGAFSVAYRENAHMGTTAVPLTILRPPTFVAPTLTGDYDGNGQIDDEDYLVWRSSFGVTRPSTADGNNDGIVDAIDYVLWRDNLPAVLLASSSVPEASPLVLGYFAAITLTLFYRR